METDDILALLRNPHGIAADDLRAARLAAADLIEAVERRINDYADALESLREWCLVNGLDPVSYPTGVPPKPLEDLRAMRGRAHLLAERTAHAYFVACDVGEERIIASNFYEIIRTAPREARNV